MRLTKQTNYALRMLMYCAANQGTLSRIPEIAKAHAVSKLFLFKILQQLVEAGLMQTVRGRNGGVKLARPATEISVADVVKITEDNFSMAECFDNTATDCPLVNFCGLNTVLKKALNSFFDVLSMTSIADLHRSSLQNQLKIDANTEYKKIAS
ncbi:iron-responsive transcriptional regulator RirA [Bartonella sp. A05]|uniref:iron-responsive transcriptional regulator RirA n=1 Tax=Bartonella sp. A05 TaxID=2967261 RepID=UPI0022A9CBC1|nr:iron-responsive transcriptional regulator RirA [Bartonella sp. A05]MCZ2203752.1 iron-responsive transcriptional regulator RirA [Bartonella sp. A05]